jgi:hypothetical protein
MRQLIEPLFMGSALLLLPLVGLVIFVAVFVANAVRAWRGGVTGRDGEAFLPLEPDREHDHV